MIRSRSEPAHRSLLIRAVTRLLIAAYLVEAGLMLAVVPWSAIWRRNAFVTMWPWLAPIIANAFVRGAVTGVGLVTLAAGLRDFVAVVFARRSALPTDDDHRL